LLIFFFPFFWFHGDFHEDIVFFLGFHGDIQ
jgi:hypothetical protein